MRLQLGVQGAALATIIGDTCFSAIGWVFYAGKKHEIHFAKLWPHYGKLFREVFSVGMAQFFNHVAMSATSLIQNIVMLRLAGEDGLAAFSIVGYLQYLLGSSMGGFADLSLIHICAVSASMRNSLANSKCKTAAVT